MKRFVAVLLLIVIAVVAAPFLLHDDRPTPPLRGLPWQVETQPDGSTRVFDFQLGESTLAQAQGRFGDEMELAIIAAPGEEGALEAYVSRFTAGVLTGKLILSADLPQATLQQMRSEAAGASPTATGALKLSLSKIDRQRALQAPITAITFVPSVNIDQQTALQRFGEPAQRVRDRDGATHFLYPDKGLDLILHPERKEVLQYVAPARFDALTAPLRADKP